MSKARSFLYRLARVLGDVEAVSSGKPERVVKRVVRKAVHRSTGKLLRKLFK
jgi:hypothetical protein